MLVETDNSNYENMRRASFLPTEEDPVLFIRVQRRRAVTAAATLRVGLDAASATTAALLESDLLGNNSSTKCNLNSSFCQRGSTSSSTTALFRRVEEHDPMMRRCTMDTQVNATQSATKRACIVDAVLVEDEDNDEFSGDRGNNKRRKVTLQLASSWVNNSSSNSVMMLTKEQRLVDESLENVFQGAQSVRQHCELLRQLSPVANTGREAWTWNHGTSGNWLHAAALWGEVAVVEENLHWLKQQLNDSSPHPTVLSHLLAAVDGDGNTPCTVAEISGHTGVVEVLESFGGQKSERSPNDDDDESVQYDIYCLVPNNTRSTVETPVEVSESSLVLDCEFQNGCVGYWNNHGELVLDSAPTADTYIEEDSGEDDIDSNDENYQGNDYPEDDSDDDQSNASENYRNRAVPAFHHRGGSYDDENEYDYDPTYSGIVSHGPLEYDDNC